MSSVVARDTRIDGLKFILIFLVILGHISYYDYGLRINRIIYSFHMPLFVMISGFFTHRQSPQRFWHASLKLLSLYLIFQTGHLIYNTWALGIPFSITGFLNPSLAMWYLLCLFYWRCAYHFTRPLGIKPAYALLLSIVLSVVVGFIPLGNKFLAFQRAFAFLPFFIFGLMLHDGELRRIIHQFNVHFVVVASLIALVGAYFLPLFEPSEPYSVWNDAILRLLQMGIAFIICIGIIRLLPTRLPNLFCEMGRRTLYFYLYHTFMVKVINDVSLHYQWNTQLFGALFWAITIVLIIALMCKVKLFRLLLLEH